MKITMFLVLTLAMILVLPGCAQQRMTKVGAAATEYDSDRARCEYEVHLSDRRDTSDIGDAVVSGIENAQLINQCMNLKGWK